ncbi:MAG TPA: DUF87 domain-containing protein [Candidatus Dormibacteraeota bacterium]
MRFQTGALGYLGARADDRSHWLGAFRHLLDGIDRPLQVVLRFTPGSGSDAPTMAMATTPAARRAADLAFAAHLRDSTAAQRREVELVAASASADALRAGLQDIGVEILAEGSDAQTELAGEETLLAFHDDAGCHRTWWLERFPGGDLEPGWLLRLAPPGCAVSISWHASPLPTAWMVDYLQRQLAAMRATRAAASGRTDPALEGALPAAEDLQRRLVASQERAFHVALYLTLTTPTVAELADASEQVAQAGRAALCRLEPCTFEMAAGRLATLPCGTDPLRRARVLDTSSLCTLFPWLDPDLQQPGGLLIGTSRATGCPVLLDPFDQARYANANIGVFGHSGAGKTFLMSTLALGAHATGAQVFVLDPEHEYGGLVWALGGIDVRLALGSGHALNVLELPPGPRIEAQVGPAVADTVDLVSVICGGLDEADRVDVEEAARAAYTELEAPLLRDVAKRVKAPRPAVILRRWVGGSLGALFSAPTNIDLDAPIVVFGMRELREELVAPVHFLLARALWNRIKARGRRRLLVVDELGLLFEDLTIRRFVVSLARRIRKYDGALVFATQNPGDLLSTDAGAVVATNPAIHFFGATRPGEAARLQEAFHLSAAQRSTIEAARRGQFLLTAGPERLAVNVRCSPWQSEVMTQGRDPPRS